MDQVEALLQQLETEQSEKLISFESRRRRVIHRLSTSDENTPEPVETFV